MDDERPYAAAFREIEGHDDNDPISEAWRVLGGSKKSFNDIVQFANTVQSVVSSTIGFARLSHAPDQFILPDRVAREAKTNCYGNTIIMSELLEEFDVTHYVAFVNQHAFPLLYDYPSRRSYMVDLHPSLRMEVTDAVRIALPKEWQLGG